MLLSTYNMLLSIYYSPTYKSVAPSGFDSLRVLLSRVTVFTAMPKVV